MLIQERLDAGLGPAVDAKGFVVGADHHAFGPERRVQQEDARARVLLPMEWRFGVTFTFHALAPSVMTHWVFGLWW